MKKFLSLLLVFSFCLSLASCATTPEKPVVMQKDQEQLIETAKEPNPFGETIQQQTKAPEHLTGDSPNDTEKFSIHMDADIHLPNADAVQMIRIGVRSITQEEVDHWISFLFGEQTLYTQSSLLQETKNGLQGDLIRMKQILSLIESGENSTEALGGYGSVEELQEDIASVELQMQTAPETRSMTEATHQLQKGALAVASQSETGNLQTLSILNAINADSEWNDAPFLFYWNTPEEFGASPNYIIVKEEDLEDWQDFPSVAKAWDSNPKCTLTMEQAEEQGDSFLHGLNLSEYCMVKATPAFCSIFPKNGNLSGRHGWLLEYRRKVNDIPVTWTYQPYSSSPFSAIWNYEAVSLFISEEGVMHWKLESPCALKETLSENCSLLEFDRILEIFYQMVPIIYRDRVEAEGSTVIEDAFSVNRIVFGYSRIIQQNQNYSGLLIPTWSFFGAEQYSIQNGDQTFSGTIPDRSILTINAIDGSVIDLDKGY